jgi:DNA-binding CsgD family transcriptional regulator
MQATELRRGGRRGDGAGALVYINLTSLVAAEHVSAVVLDSRGADSRDRTLVSLDTSSITGDSDLSQFYAGGFSGARALLPNDLEAATALDPDVIAPAFELTRAEARLAALVAGGAASGQAARRLGIGLETARSQLKAVFAKTGTHRQSGLAALLLRLVWLLLGALPLELACM